MESNYEQAESNLVKLVTGHEAIGYKIEKTDESVVTLLEFCRIAKGQMLINYGKRDMQIAQPEELGNLYKSLKIDELNRIIKILSDAMKDIGY